MTRNVTCSWARKATRRANRWLANSAAAPNRWLANTATPNRWLAPRASEHMEAIDDAVWRGHVLVAYCRETIPANTAHLRDQKRTVRKAAAYRRARVAATVYVIGPGCDAPNRARPPVWRFEARAANGRLIEKRDHIGSYWQAVALAAAIAERYAAKLAATEACRFLRSTDWHPKVRPDALPSHREYRKLKDTVRGVPLVTLTDPDLPPKGIEAKRGQAASGNYGGRPRARRPGYLKERRAKCQPQVKAMQANGATLDEIAAVVRLPRSTIARWMRG